jgi:hypothetical protein
MRNGRGGKKMETFEEWKKRRGKGKEPGGRGSGGWSYLSHAYEGEMGEIGRLVCLCLFTWPLWCVPPIKTDRPPEVHWVKAGTKGKLNLNYYDRLENLR